MGKYINLNAKVGMGEDYENGAQVLAEMDRLGIYTTVMEYTTGSNARYLNGKLLDMIRQLPQDRVIPGYYLGMQAVFENGGIEALREMLQERPGCVVLYPKDAKYQLRNIEMALQQLEDLPLVVMMDAPALAKVSISFKSASVKESNPFSKTKCRQLPKKVSPAPVVSMVCSCINAGTSTLIS